MAFIIGLFGLFLFACLTYWWVRGGVIPAIMLTLPLLAALPVLAVSMFDTMAGKAQPNAALPVAMLVLLGLAAAVWTPRILARRRRVAPRYASPASGIVPAPDRSQWRPHQGGAS